MAFRVLSTVRDVPELMRAQGTRMMSDLGETQARLKRARESYSRWLRRQVHNAREAGETQLWQMHLTTLERAQQLLDRTPEVPVLERVGSGARGLLESLERTTTQPPMADYDDLNVRKVMGALRDLDRLGLLRLHHYEAHHRGRKTILDAVQRELDHRARINNLP